MFKRHAVLGLALSAVAGVAAWSLALPGGTALAEHEAPAKARVQTDDDLAIVNRAQLDARFERLLETAREIDHITHRPIDGVARERLHESILRLKADVRRMRNRLEKAPAPRVRRRGPVAMSDQAFRNLVKSLRRTSYADDKLQVLRDAASHAHFTSEQAAALVGTMPSWTEVRAGVALHPRILDHQNFHLVYRTITFRSDREILRRRLERGGQQARNPHETRGAGRHAQLATGRVVRGQVNRTH